MLRLRAKGGYLAHWVWPEDCAKVGEALCGFIPGKGMRRPNRRLMRGLRGRRDLGHRHLPKCFDEKLVPWLLSQGAQIEKKEESW